MPLLHPSICLLLVLAVSCDSGPEVTPISNFPYQWADTPPMGWNSWNKFHCNINEDVIMQMTDVMASNGMKEAGYTYIVIDDCWQTGRDQYGNILADSVKFPSGIGFLSDYIHSKGLKFGIYSSVGSLTCQGRPGSYQYEETDARQYAAWGVDYLKYDWCHADIIDPKGKTRKMISAILENKRPVVFSITASSSLPWTWAKGICHLWRTTNDIVPYWDTITANQTLGIMQILDAQNGLEKYSGPGHWNDPDMLEIGNGSLSITECRAHFSLWCILAAPLIAGNDLRDLDANIAEILINKEAIRVDQDSLGNQGKKIDDSGDLEVWCKILANGDQAVVLLNRGSNENLVTLNFESLLVPRQSFYIRDLWLHENLGSFENRYEANVPSHDVKFIRLSGQPE